MTFWPLILIALAAAPPTVTLSTTVEDGKKMLVATVKRDGAPVEGASVRLQARRSFGWLTLGEDETLDDGTAAAPFPADLPGRGAGELTLAAEVVAPEELAGARVEAVMAGGARPTPAPNLAERALWAPRAPVGLVAVIVTLLAGVWLTYLFVLVQLRRIKKEEAS